MEIKEWVDNAEDDEKESRKEVEMRGRRSGRWNEKEDCEKDGERGDEWRENVIWNWRSIEEEIVKSSVRKVDLSNEKSERDKMGFRDGKTVGEFDQEDVGEYCGGEIGKDE
eukprot:CAMPEP_0182443348 /NCGR_PEP_ID=MMETSP1172-20130603/2112_1 /TAXON_ID=708627 /ORGANISM="Timspurckia oligopyrenoides, Strain CCMP3278" /LENGTH=110 /DNA_ID=CAMNT_0024638605 /DNA_START=581 /DNA_END=913 /DNA_ORIENTATION=-